MPDADGNHRWLKVYVIQCMAGRPPGEDRKVYVPGEMWSAIFGLRDDGRVYYSNFHDRESHAVAEAMFRRGADGWLDDAYCERVGATTGMIADEAGFTQHCAALAATGIPDEKGQFGMFERKDMEGEKTSWEAES